MARYLLLTYIVLVAVGGIGLQIAYALLVPAREKKNDSWWEIPLTVVLLSVALAGMLFLYVDLRSPALKALWKPVSVVVLGSQLYLNLRDRIGAIRSPLPAEERGRLIRAADVLTLAFVLPSSVLSLVYAFR